MRDYPQPGERWRHERGWTVTIIRLTEAPPSVALVNPEFSREVLIRHDSDNQLSSCPLAWFKQRYGVRKAAQEVAQVLNVPDMQELPVKPARQKAPKRDMSLTVAALMKESHTGESPYLAGKGFAG